MDLPVSKRVLHCKWVFKIKHIFDGKTERLKGRLIVCGGIQRSGIDYNVTYSTVLKMRRIMCILIVAVKKGWRLSQLGFNNAFLHWELQEKIYMKVPLGLKTH